MEFHRDAGTDANVIRAYGAEGVRVGTQLLRASCLISRERILADWPVTDAAALSPADLDQLLALDPELVVFGTGEAIVFPPAEIGAALARRGIGFEYMDTAAACRTYNVLVHEGRNVVAALIVGA